MSGQSKQLSVYLLEGKWERCIQARHATNRCLEAQEAALLDGSRDL